MRKEDQAALGGTATAETTGDTIQPSTPDPETVQECVYSAALVEALTQHKTAAIAIDLTRQPQTALAALLQRSPLRPQTVVRALSDQIAPHAVASFGLRGEYFVDGHRGCHSPSPRDSRIRIAKAWPPLVMAASSSRSISFLWLTASALMSVQKKQRLISTTITVTSVQRAIPLSRLAYIGSRQESRLDCLPMPQSARYDVLSAAAA